MDLTKVKEKGGGLLSKFREILSIILARVFSPFSVVFDRIPEEKRRPILFCIGGLFALFLIIFIVLRINAGRPERVTAPELATGPSIPVEDLFIPAEPDFLPQFLLEREPRQFWSLDDIRPFWRNPLYPELWRGEIHSAVDRLMEGVP